MSHRSGLVKQLPKNDNLIHAISIAQLWHSKNVTDAIQYLKI